MRQPLSRQLTCLSQLAKRALAHKWARNGDWWYYNDDATGRLMRARVENKNEWWIEGQSKIRLRNEATPVFPIEDYLINSNVEHDLSDDGQYGCVAIRSSNKHEVELIVFHVTSGRVAFRQTIYDLRIEKIFLSHTGDIVYFTSRLHPNHGRTLWGIRLGRRGDSHPICLFPNTSNVRLTVSRTNSHRFLKVISTKNEQRTFLLYDLHSTELDPGIVIGTGSSNCHYTIEHLVSQTTDLALIVQHSKARHVENITCLRLNDLTRLGVFFDVNSDIPASLSNAASIHVNSSTVIATFLEGLAAKTLVYHYDYDRQNTLSFQPRQTITVPPMIEPILLRPLDWNQPHLEILASSLVSPPELIYLNLDAPDPDPTAFHINSDGHSKEVVTSHHRAVHTYYKVKDTPAGVTVASSPFTQHPTNGCVVMGYGAYGRSLPRGFSPLLAILLNHGIDVAIAHVRGGGEFGYAWHQQGTGLNKKNSFEDYLAICEYIREKGARANPSYKIIGLGASAGGLLVAAAANLKPTMFDGIALIAPFLSPLRSLMDPTAPLTVSDWREFGNPTQEPGVKSYIASYSPMENIPSCRMPDCFVGINESDLRVSNQHIKEWCHRIRNTGANVETEVRFGADHSGMWQGEQSSQVLLLEWIIKRMLH